MQSGMKKWLGAAGVLAAFAAGSAWAAAPAGYSCGDGLQGTLYNLNGTTYPATSPSFSLFNNLTPVDKAVALPNNNWGSLDPNPPFANDDPAVIDHFADQWVGAFVAPSTDDYVFGITGDDGVALWLSKDPINPRTPGAPTTVYHDDGAGAPTGDPANPWIDQGATTYDAQPMHLNSGDVVYIVFDHYENGGGAQSTLMVNGQDFDLASLCAPPASTPATISSPPPAIKDLSTSDATSGSITLNFTAPAAGDGKSMLAFYDIRYSMSQITDANFDKATAITSYPAAPGTKQSITVSGLQPLTTYYFAIKSIDGSYPTPNVSPVSNVVTGDTGGPPASTIPAVKEDQPGITGYYYTGTDKGNTERLSGHFPDKDFVYSEVDPNVSFNWGNDSPDLSDKIAPDGFSVRWVGKLHPPQDGSYVFASNTDDGGRLWLSDAPININAPGAAIIDQWVDQGPTITKSQPITLSKSKTYYILYEYYENGGGAVAQLQWFTPDITDTTDNSQLVDIPTDVLTTASANFGQVGSLKGVVTNEKGSPTPNVIVTSSIGGSATTDANGAFNLLMPGGTADITLNQSIFGITSVVSGVSVIGGKQNTQNFTLTGGLTPIATTSLRSADLTAAGNPGWSFLVFPDSTIFGAATAPDMDALKTYQDPNIAITGTDKTSGGTWITGWGPVPGDREPADHANPLENDIPDNDYWAQAVKVKLTGDAAKGTQYTLQGFNVDDYLTMAAVNGTMIGQDLTGNYSKVWTLPIPATAMKTDGSDNLIMIIGYEGGGGAGMTTDNGGPALVTWGLGAGGVTPPPTTKLGDLNGDGNVNVQDATLSLRIAVGLLTPSDAQKAADDANHDGKWNVQDATLILRAAVGLGTLS
jgi:hypothetical protein